MEKKIIKIPDCESGRLLSDWLSEHGYDIAMPCGGRGVCRNCRVELAEGGEVLACRTVIPAGGFTIVAPETQTECDVRETAGGEDVYLALDVGTTTLALSAVNARDGGIIGRISMLNPQRSCGADVMNRILACKNGKLTEMRELLLRDVRKMIGALGVIRAGKMYAVGNPTMLHIFCGISPEGMGAYPFTPAFTETKRLPGDGFGLPVGEVVVMPSASAFIGSDVTAGVMAVDLQKHSASMLVDIGTNGEIVLNVGGKLFTASTAAGPALEGANISCGVGGVGGAVSKVYVADGKLIFRTIGDKKPIGVCGCGLVELIAALLDLGVIDETGYLEGDEYKIAGIHEDPDGRIISEGDTGLTLTRRDVREFQLAKSAIYAGIMTLIGKSGIDPSRICAVYIAGGLGFYLNFVCAVRVGMLPACLISKLRACGNSALTGAEACASDGAKLELVAEIAGKCRNVELNSEPEFSELFVENMIFPEGG